MRYNFQNNSCTRWLTLLQILILIGLKVTGKLGQMAPAYNTSTELGRGLSYQDMKLPRSARDAPGNEERTVMGTAGAAWLVTLN